MKQQEHRSHMLDVAALARDGARLSGDLGVGELHRLAQSVLAASHAKRIEWSAQGELRRSADGSEQVWLHLHACTQVDLQCQRCLEQVTQALEVQREFEFVRGGEAVAAQRDAHAEHDVLPLPTHLDLQELLEDELLLALPVIPRHGQCTLFRTAESGDGAAEGAPPEAEKDTAAHPFAALAALRHRTPSSG